MIGKNTENFAPSHYTAESMALLDDSVFSAFVNLHEYDIICVVGVIFNSFHHSQSVLSFLHFSHGVSSVAL